MSASRVLGQVDLLHNTNGLVTARGLHSPWFVVVDSTHNRAFVSDAGTTRVLWWNNAASLTTGKPADGVLGQQDFHSKRRFADQRQEPELPARHGGRRRGRASTSPTTSITGSCATARRSRRA